MYIYTYYIYSHTPLKLSLRRHSACVIVPEAHALLCLKCMRYSAWSACVTDLYLSLSRHSACRA